MKSLLINDETAIGIEKVKRMYYEGLIPDQEFYNRFFDCLIKEFYNIKMPEIMEIPE